jgi:uracil-DNA glycosylase family 4
MSRRAAAGSDRELQPGVAWGTLRRAIIGCTACPRLVAHRRRVAIEKRAGYREWHYWGRPVPGFGDRRARLLIVGLAPAAHGANRTGRMFTGDRSGEWLFDALYRTGFANQPGSIRRGDGLKLHDARISAIVRCAPPQNLPSRAETAACRRFLEEELRLLRDVRVVVCLGALALRGLLDAWRGVGGSIPVPSPAFRHAAVHRLPQGPWLLLSYHPSQQNTFTGRLTRRMLRDVFRRARRLIDAESGYS